VKVGIETDRGAWMAAFGRGWLWGVRDQSDVGDSLPGAPLEFGGEVW